jgi:hypothetical protein
MGEQTRQSLILLVFGLVAALSGAACYYFSLFRPRRPAVAALVLLTAFIFWQDVLWGSVFAVATMDNRVVGFQVLVRHLLWPILAVGALGTLGTGLLFLLIIRREWR